MFGFIIILILVGIIFTQSKDSEKLNAKIYDLQCELRKAKQLLEENGLKLDEKNNSQERIESGSYLNNNIVHKNEESKAKIDSTTSRNLSILITGSILIVLAAIVFLTTAWQTIPNFVKTIVLFLVAFVFIGASKISKEKYKLEKTGKTFFYIGMAYLPICFLSISIFGLFGSYLSATGDGKYLFLGFSCLILALLYYFVSKKSEDKYLFYGSLLSQIFSVILFTLMFEERGFLVCINLLLYNLLLMLIIRDTKEDIFDIVENVLPAIIAVGVISEFGNGTWNYICTCLLLCVNLMFLEMKNSNIIKSIAFNVFLFDFWFSLISRDGFNLSDGTCQVLMTLFIGSVFVVEHLLFARIKENKNLLISTRLVSLVSLIYVYLGSVLSESSMIIPSYVIAILGELLLICNFKTSKNLFYKYLAYIFTNVVLFDVNQRLFADLDLTKYIPMFTTVMLMLYEMYYVREKDGFNKVYFTIFEVIALIYLPFKINEAGAIIAIAFTLFSIYYNNKKEFEKWLNAMPLICVLPSILYSGLNDQLELGIMLLSTIGLTYFSVIHNQINIYTIISGIYLFITSGRIDSKYLNELLYIVWGVMHIYFYKNEKAKDIFKVLTTIFILMLYHSIIEDLRLTEITLFSFLGIVVSGIYIIKNIVSKYNSETDLLEYIFWGFIYFSALTSYVDSRDGIMFSILILGVIFYSYYKKYGATFLAGIIAILVNAFALTREFWLSVPWWIYLLVVGGLLVGFAIKNEASENKKKITVGSVLKEIKDKVER